MFKSLEDFRKELYGEQPATIFEKELIPRPSEGERGFLEEAGSALGAGAISTLGAISGTAEMLGIPGGKTAREYWAEIGQRESLVRPEYLQDGTVLEHPERLLDWRWWTRSLGENIPNMASMMLPGLGAMKAAKLLGWGEKAIRTVSLAGAWTGAATVEAGFAYNQAKEEMAGHGYSDQEIEQTATMEGLTVGVVNGILEILPFKALFLDKIGAPRVIRRIIRQAWIEGTTETAQEAVNIYVEKLGHKPDQTLSDNIGRLLESGIIGGALGGGAALTLGKYGVEKKEIEEEPPIGESGSPANAELIKDIGEEPALKEKAAEQEEISEKEEIRANASDLLDQVMIEEEAAVEEVPEIEEEVRPAEITEEIVPDRVEEALEEPLEALPGEEGLEPAEEPLKEPPEALAREENKRFTDVMDRRLEEIAPEDPEEREKLRKEFFKERLAPWWAATPYEEKVNELEGFIEKRERPPKKKAEEVAKPEAKTTASFLAWQETPEGDHIATYNIESGPKKGTQMMVEGLEREGIEIPETPKKPPKKPSLEEQLGKEKAEEPAKPEVKPTAVFKNWQEDGKGGYVALYEYPLPDGRLDTVSAETLKEKGIAVPETPEKPPKVPSLEEQRALQKVPPIEEKIEEVEEIKEPKTEVQSLVKVSLGHKAFGMKPEGLKRGDKTQARKSIEKNITEERLKEVSDYVRPSEKVVYIPIPSAEDVENVVPTVYAEILSEKIGGKVRDDVGSLSKKIGKRCLMMNGWEKLVTKREFKAKSDQLPEGSRVFIVDDVFTDGGTIRDMASALETAGYNVEGFLTIGSSRKHIQKGNRIKASPETLNKVTTKFNTAQISEIEESVGYSLDDFTEGELRIILGAKDIIDFRKKISKAKKKYGIAAAVEMEKIEEEKPAKKKPSKAVTTIIGKKRTLEEIQIKAREAETKAREKLLKQAASQKFLVPWIAISGGMKKADLPGEINDILWTTDAMGRKKLRKGVMRGFQNKTGRPPDVIAAEAKEMGFPVKDTDNLIELIEKDLNAVSKGDIKGRVTKVTTEPTTENEFIEGVIENAREELRKDGASEEEIGRILEGGRKEGSDIARITPEDEVEENAEELSKWFEEQGKKARKPTQEALLEKESKFELKPTEPTEAEKIAIGKARGEIVSPEKKAKPAVIPTEKIPTATKGEQASLLPKKKGEQIGLEEAIEEKDKFDSGVDKVKDSDIQYVYDPASKEKQYSIFDFKPAAPARTVEAPETGKVPPGQSVRVHTTGNIKASGTVISGIEDAASLLASIRKKAQEDFYSIAVDKDGTILEIHRYSKGTKAAVGVSPIEVVGRALNIPTVKRVYVVHNHPSGQAYGSEGDIGLTYHIESLLKADDVRTDHIVIGATKYAAVPRHYVGREVVAFKIPPMLRKVSIPIKERYLVRKPELEKRDKVTVPPDAIKAFETYANNADGVLFIDQGNRPITFLPFIKGRSMKETTKDIIKVAESTNASAMIVNNNTITTERTQYIQALAHGTLGGDFDLIDVIENGKSWVQERGMIMGKAPMDYTMLLGETRLQLEAFHGTPYDFERFTTEAIGKGEGAQAFGWGLYFTNEEDIARFYADQLAKRGLVYDGEQLSKDQFIDKIVSQYGEDSRELANRIDHMFGSGYLGDQIVSIISKMSKEQGKIAEEITKGLQRVSVDTGWNITPTGGIRAEDRMSKRDQSLLFDIQGRISWYRKSVDALSEVKDSLRATVKAQEKNIIEFKEKGNKADEDRATQIRDDAARMLEMFDEYNLVAKYLEPKRHVYRVTLHKGKSPTEYNYLDWHKPISEEQFHKIQDRIDEEYKAGQVHKNDLISALNSAHEHKHGADSLYKRFADILESEKEASLLLLRAGIDGIKYKAGTLAGIESKAYNYVVFDESAISIEDLTKFAMEPALAAEPRGYEFTKQQQKDVNLIEMIYFPQWLEKSSFKDLANEIRVKVKPYIDLTEFHPRQVAGALARWEKEGVTAGKILGAATVEGMETKITLALNGRNLKQLEHTTYHELYERFRNEMVSAKDRTRLDKDPFFKTIESEADAFAEYNVNAAAIKAGPNFIKRVFLKLKRLLTIIRNGLNARGFYRPEDIWGTMRVGARVPRKSGRPAAGIAFEQKPPEEGLLVDAEKSPVFFALGKKPKPKKRALGVATITGAAREKIETKNRFVKHFKEFWKPFSTLPEGEKALVARYKAMGDVARAMRFIEGIHAKLDTYPDDVKQDIFRFLDGQVTSDVLPGEAAKVAESLKERTLTIGKMLLKRGILKQEQFDKYKGRYIHYMYARHILGDEGSIGLTSSGKLNLSYTRKRNPDLTMDQRKQLGLIEDASVAVPVGMGKALTDIAKYDYMTKIAENDEWVWQPSLVEVVNKQGKKITMGIGKLIEEVDTYERMIKESPSPETRERYNILKNALDKAIEETENVPEDFVQLPTTKTYGPLAGAFIRKPIADDIKPLVDALAKDRGKIFNTLMSIETQGMALFKMGKVALNLPTAFRNVISNILQNNMRGRALMSIPGDIVNGCKSMLEKDQYYEEAFRHGIFKTNWFVTEVNDVLDEFRKAQKGGYAAFLNAVKGVAKYYGKIDDISKHSIFVQLRKEGRPVDEALLEAMKWGMDYSLASRSVKTLRKHLIPFISFQYKVAPLVLESLKKRPWVVGKFAIAIPMLVKMMAKEYNDMDDDDWKEIENQLPTYVKKSGSMMILPWKTPKGQWQFLNLEYFFPWGNYLNIFRDIKEKDMGEIYRGMGISNPFMDIARMAASAREDQPPQHPFYGTPIYNRLDSPAKKVAKLTDFLAFTWLPGMMSRKGALGYSIMAATGREDRWGRTVTPAQAIGRWFGANILSVSPELSMAIASVKMQDLRKELYRVLKDPSKSEAAKEAAEQTYREKVADLAEASPGAILPITKAKGEDKVFEELNDLLRKGALTMGPPSKVIHFAGRKLEMNLEQYSKYLEGSSAIARRKLGLLISSPGWFRWSDERKTTRIRLIVKNARKRARGRIKRMVLRQKYRELTAKEATKSPGHEEKPKET